MLKSIPQQFRNLPTPMAGLALGVASLGVCLELALPLHGAAQVICALIAAVLLGLLSMRYFFHFDTLAADLRHPVLGSIAPTFAMCLMVLSKTLGMVSTTAGTALWLFAVLLHVVFLVVFAYNRFKTPGLDLMVPSWFVPPVGLIVADVTLPGAEGLYPVAIIILAVGMAAYAVMLPVMLYRIFFYSAIPAGAQPTIAIMAAPASLSLAGYLTVVKAPNLLVGGILLGIALLMTLAIYFAFWRLLRLQFSPGYAAFTFPMAIGATALYKASAVLEAIPAAAGDAAALRLMAHVELVIATIVIVYVLTLYIKNFKSFLPVKPKEGA